MATTSKNKPNTTPARQAGTAAPTAREYLRVSLDKSGRARSITEQHADNEREADAYGWTLGEPYSADASISASRYSRKVRGDFAKLLADLEGGRFGASVLILWEPSRGSRKVSEWCQLIELCERWRVSIHVTTHGRTYDPTNARDRRSLQEDAVDSEYETAKTSSRVKRTMAINASDGKPHGRIPYGYSRRYNPRNGDYVAQEVNEAEAKVVRTLFERLEKGHSLRAIARDFAAEGITNDKGAPFSPAHLRVLAVSPTYIAKRVHNPGNGAEPTTVDGDWPPLVDKKRFYAVQRLLTAPERRTSRPGRGKHLLSMLALCHHCGGVLAASERSGGQYQCHTRGCIRINRAELDAYAEQVILGYLGRDDVREVFTAQQGENAELTAVAEELAGVRAELDNLADAVAAGTITVALAGRAEPQLRDRLARLEKRERELSTPDTLAGLIEPGQDVAERWQAAPMSTRRAVVRLLLAKDGALGELRVTRSPIKGHRVPVEQRVRIEPR